MRVWPLLFAFACQGPSPDAPKKRPEPDTSAPTPTGDDDDDDLGLDHDGNVAYLHLAPNPDREAVHRLLAFFAEDLQELPFPAACVVAEELCIDQIPTEDDTWVEPSATAFNPNADRIVWVGDRIYLGEMPVDFIADAEAQLGWYERPLDVFPDDALLDVTLAGEWESYEAPSFLPKPAPIELLTPPPEEFVALANLEEFELTWTPGDGEVYLDVDGPNGFRRIYKLEDDGSYDFDVSVFGGFSLGDLSTFDLIRVLSDSTDARGNHLVAQGISTQRFHGGFALPRTCLDHLSNDPNLESGIYEIQPDLNPPVDVYCDMDTDGGGWTLVAATAGQPLDDAAGPWHTGLTSLYPGAPNTTIWNGLRSVITTTSDIRFTCKADPSLGPMDVDLSFYDTRWYREFTTGNDGDSCFSEANGAGYDVPAVARKNNLNGDTRTLGQDWETQGYLEGEDTCDDTTDFSIDFTDRGMDGNQSDGTDWGEDDGSYKCAVEALPGGAWFVFVREL